MTLAYEKDLGQVLKTFRVSWYRSPIDNPTLTQLCESNDLKGAIQALGHFGLFVALGTLAVVFYYQQQWWLFVLALWLQGLVGSNFGHAVHELLHGTVFKTQRLNRLFVGLFGLFHHPLGWGGHHQYKMSHTFHHRYTLHPGADNEVILPQKPILSSLLLLQLFTINLQAIHRVLRDAFLVACRRFSERPLQSTNPSGPTKWIKALSAVYPKKQRDAVRAARITLCFHSAVLLIAITFELWWLPLVVTAPVFISGWLVYFMNVAQHGGLRNDVPDFRLCTRSIRLNPFFEFLYWHMNYHVEHHMYAAVPCYNLPKLHRVIANDLPEQKTLLGAWREMRATFKRQKNEPDYQFDPPLPATANPAHTLTRPGSTLSDTTDDLAASIGPLAPAEEQNLLNGEPSTRR